MFFQNRGRLWLLLSAALVAAHLAWNYGALPEKVPTHFGPDGTADGWMPKAGYAQFELILIGGMSALFWGIGWLVKVVPTDAINLPNREYWLAPQRRDETIRKISDELASFGAAMNVFFLGVQDQTVRAVLSGTNKLGPMFSAYLILFLLYTGFWVVGLYRRWGRG